MRVRGGRPRIRLPFANPGRLARSAGTAVINRESVMKNRIALALLAAFVASPAVADEYNGFYWGFDLGQYSYGLDRNQLDSQIVDGLEQQGLTVLSGSSETSEDGFTWGITLGYQILRYLAVEAQYVDLGSAEYKVNARVTDGVTQADVRSGVEVDSSGFSVSGLGILPVWDTGWDVYGRVGMYFGSNDAELNVTADSTSDRFTDDSSSESFFWGVGAGYTRGQWTSRLEYQQYTDVGDDSSGLGQADIDRIVFSAVYRTDFGAWGRR
jgi:opacity protein-like surface antigen